VDTGIVDANAWIFSHDLSGFFCGMNHTVPKIATYGGDPNAKQWRRSGDGSPKLFGRQTDQER
jgi:hypothetical protein